MLMDLILKSSTLEIVCHFAKIVSSFKGNIIIIFLSKRVYKWYYEPVVHER